MKNLGLNSEYLVRNRRMAIENSEIMDECADEYSIYEWESIVDYYDHMHNGDYEEYCVAFINIIIREFLS